MAEKFGELRASLAFADTIETEMAKIPGFVGRNLSPQDAPMTTAEFMSFKATNLAISEVGDVSLRRGDLPPYGYSDPEPPIWAHRATGSTGDHADGGVWCVVESFVRRKVLRFDDVPVNLVVRNGRWRVGRGWLCMMGRSPRPEGGWKVYLPWSARGKALRAASLQVLESGNAVVASGDEVFWDSSSP